MKGVERLHVRVPASSEAAIRLLERFGFETFETHKGVLQGPDGPLDELSMLMDLPDEAA